MHRAKCPSDEESGTHFYTVHTTCIHTGLYSPSYPSEDETNTFSRPTELQPEADFVGRAELAWEDPALNVGRAELAPEEAVGPAELAWEDPVLNIGRAEFAPEAADELEASDSSIAVAVGMLVDEAVKLRADVQSMRDELTCRYCCCPCGAMDIWRGMFRCLSNEDVKARRQYVGLTEASMSALPR